MPKASPIQTSFNGGIQTPLLAGNIQAPNREFSYASSENLIPIKQGPVVRRGGTKQVSEVKVSADSTILVNFRRNSSEAFQIEFGDLYVRFYKDNLPVTEDVLPNPTGITSTTFTFAAAHNYSNGDHIIVKGSDTLSANDRQLVVAGVTSLTFTLTDILGIAITMIADVTPTTTTVERIYTIVSPYPKTDLLYPSGYDPLQSPALDFVQSTDTLFITHPNHTKRTLKRNDNDTDWVFAIPVFKDGPYLPIDGRGITITPSANSGTGVTLTASSGIFSVTDTIGSGGTSAIVNRRIRLRSGAADSDGIKRWAWALIETFTSATVVTIDFQEGGSLFDTTAVTEWRLGLFHEGGTPIPGETSFTISAATAANPVVITTSATHNLRVKDYMTIEGVVGMIELNGNTYRVAAETDTTITLDEVDGTDVDGTGFTTYTSGGNVTMAWLNLPRNIALYEDRFCFSGAISDPERIDMTITGGYSPTILRFDPTAPDGSVTSDLSITAILGGSELNSVNWMRPADRGLAVGTTGGEGLIASSTQGEALTPANVSYKQHSTTGSNFVRPVPVPPTVVRRR